MNRRQSLSLRSILFGCFLIVGCAACSSLIRREDDCDGDCHGHAKVCHNPTVMNLARDLDHLENHIERNGSVVIQKPSIWGQARLMMYRREVEEQMSKQIENFQETLQGRMQREDQAFFVQANALGIAASGRGAVTAYPGSTVSALPTTAGTQVTNVVQPSPIDNAYLIGVAKLKPDGTIDPTSVDPKSQAFVVPTSLRSASSTAQQFNTTTGTGTDTQLKISLEPTIALEQRKRYLDFLNQIRRTNEGDDTADSPGYALHVVRIPVSVLPGKHTQKGHGAEVTMTIEPVLGEELLPVTMRNLIINDIVDQIGFSLTRVLNDEDYREEFLSEEVEYLIHNIKKDGPACKLKEEKNQKVPGAKENPATPAPSGSEQKKSNKQSAQRIHTQMAAYATSLSQGKNAAPPSFLKAAFKANPSHSRMRNADLPMPSTQLIEVYGVDYAFHIGYSAKLVFEKQLDPPGPQIVHLHDIQNYLDEQLAAAHKFLSVKYTAKTATVDLWTHCTLELANAVKTRNQIKLDQLRCSYQNSIRTAFGEKCEYKCIDDVRQSRVYSVTAALGWAILVEAALLNDRLVQDIDDTASARQKGLPKVDSAGGSALWVTPDIFHQYVKARWPIHVFALDPESQDQNIGDSFTRRREMQMALSLAFANGKISARNFTRYARRIDSEYDTIAINRTAVGFSHGEDTFGWRFYPRFQTPDIDSNAKSLVRDQLIGGPSKDQELAQRKLEPGIRECVAIVIMPAFVPYVEIHSTSNFFHLANPKCKVMDNTDAMKLSRTVQTIRTCSPNVRDAQCYRDGDFQRLLKKADQLAARLPMQTMQALVPYENTLGGFQMFSTGVTDLAPELNGWYGAPGIDPNQPTTLFLVGEHLNVKQTRVIAGGMEIGKDAPELLSRQVLRVTIPGKALTTTGIDGKQYVDVRLATPYGVTNSLLIPSLIPEPVRGEFTWRPVPTSNAKLFIETKDKVASIKEFKFDPTPKFAIVDNVGHAAEFPLAKNFQLLLRVTVYDKDGSKEPIESTPIDLEFKSGTADITADEMANKLKEVLIKAVDPKGKVKAEAGSIKQLDVAGFVGTPTPAKGNLTFPVNPLFVITVKVDVPKTAQVEKKGEGEKTASGELAPRESLAIEKASEPLPTPELIVPAPNPAPLPIAPLPAAPSAEDRREQPGALPPAPMIPRPESPGERQ